MMDNDLVHLVENLPRRKRRHSRNTMKVQQTKAPGVIRVDHPDFPFPIAVKRVREGGGSATQQFDALEKASKALGGNQRFRVPYPIAIDKKNAVLVMEWIDLPSLESRLQDWRTSTERALKLVADAGAWLRRLHQTRDLPSGPIESLRLMEGLLGSSRELPDLQRHRTLSRFLNTLDRSAPAVSQVTIARTLQHGDYKPANVLSSPQNTIGIDLHAIHEGPVVGDLSHFLNHLDFTFLTPLGMPRLVQRERFIASFLRGYAGSDLAIECAAPWFPLTWLRLHAVTRFWISEARLGNPLLRGRYRCWCYRRLGTLLDRRLAAGGKP
jgi:hypothetical protein